MTFPADFKIISELVTGKITIKENTQYNNLKVDTVIVEEHVQTRLYGVISKSLIIKRDARVILHGQIEGSIENKGGNLTILE